MVVFHGPSIQIPRVSVQTYLYRDPKAKDKWDRVIVEDGITGESFAFGDFVESAESLASEWLLPGPPGAWKINKGDVVGLIAPNHVDYFRLFFAVIRCGGVISTMNHLYRKEEFSHCIKLVKAKYLIVHPQMLETVLESAKECGIPRSNIAIFDETLIGGSIVPKTGLAKEFRSAREMMASGKAKGQKAPWIDIPESEVDKTRVWVPFSSGTTGLSKGVALSHYNLVAQAEQRLFIDADEFKIPNFTSLSAAPPAHIGGGTFMTVYLKAGVKSILLPRYEIEPALQAVEKYKITFLPVLPPIAVSILAMGGRDYLKKFDLSSIRFLSSATATMPASTEDAITKAFGVRMRQMYGMSEMTCVTHFHYMRGSDVKGSNGPPVPSLSCKLIDPKEGREVGVGEEGEVWLKGPSTFMGYVDNPKATEESITPDGWFKTGDIGICDELGFLTIVDRIKELMKVSGFQVSPAELEAILITHPAVAEACCVGVPDEMRGELPKAFLVLKPDFQPSDKLTTEIADYVAKKVAPYKKLYGGIEYVPEIVRNTMNKMQRQVYRDLERKRYQERSKTNAKL